MITKEQRSTLNTFKSHELGYNTHANLTSQNHLKKNKLTLLFNMTR